MGYTKRLYEQMQEKNDDMMAKIHFLEQEYFLITFNTLHKIRKIVVAYESGKYISQEHLIKMQRSLNSCMYHLTIDNVKAFQKWNSLVYLSDKSNAAAKVDADEEVPELRKTRKILDTCKGVSIAINSELQIMKND